MKDINRFMQSFLYERSRVSECQYSILLSLDYDQPCIGLSVSKIILQKLQ